MIAFFTVVPHGKESLSADVSAVLDLIDKSGIDYRFTAMGTIVEGNADDVWALIRQCHEKMCEGHTRVSTHITIDDRENRTDAIREKVEAVEKHLSRKLKT